MFSRKPTWVRVRWVIIAGGCLAAVGQVTQAPQQDQPRAQEPPWARQMYPNLPANQDPAAVLRGKRLFAAHCAFCHGTDATGGNSGPDLVRSTLVNHDENGELISPVVREGRAGKGMPKFSLSKTQISDVVAFLHQRNRDARLRFTYKTGNLAIGNAREGEVYFEAHCASCHSPAKDLAGIAAKYPGDELQQRWIDPHPRPAPEVTVTLASGQKYTGKLKQLDEFNVSLYDAQGAYHSFPLSTGTQVEVTNPMAAHQKLVEQLSDRDMHNLTTYLETLR